MGRAVFTHRVHVGGQYLGAIDPLILAQSRTTISLLILAPILLAVRRSLLRVQGKHVAQFFVLGILGLAASNYFYYLAIQKTTVATAIVLQYVAPVWVLLYMVARRLQHATTQRILGVVMAVLGCAIAVGLISGKSTFPWLGLSGVRFNLIGVMGAELAAISFAFYNVYGQHLLKTYHRVDRAGVCVAGRGGRSGWW